MRTETVDEIKYKNNLRCVACDNKKNFKVFKYFKEVDQEYVLCKKCGLIFISNVYPSQKLYKSYSGGLVKSLRRRILNRFRKFENYGQFTEFSLKAEKIISLVRSSQLVSSDLKVNMMDIGCNKGYLLNEGLKNGWSVYGIELIPELMTPFLKKFPELKQRVKFGRFGDVYKNINENFDLITAIDVIEHFENVVDDVSIIYNLLSKNGVLVVQTPDSSSVNAKEQGTGWGALSPHEHLFLFNKDNFVTFIKKAGFSSVKFFDPINEADGNFIAICTK